MKAWFAAARTLSRRPGYLVTSIVVLALGIGATAALFSVVNTVLLQPLPYPQANRLALVLEMNPARHENLIAPGRLAEWNARNQSFVPGNGIAGEYAESETDTGGREPLRLAGERVSPGFFQVYGTAPALGRTFNANEQRFQGPGAAVISYSLWTSRYHRSPQVLQQQLVLAGERYAIVGVMPASFTEDETGVDVWLPAQLPPALLQAREARFYTGIGRLRPGVSLAQAQADLDRVETQLGRQFPATDKGWSAQVSSLKDAEIGSSRAAIWTVFGAVVLLLLLAVANLAGLTLAQMQNRERELAMRSALGASRSQLLGGVMREMALLAAAGAIAGGLLAWVGVRAIASLAPGTLPRMSALHFSFWGWGFAVAISAVAAIGFGLLPAWAATRGQLTEGLGSGGRTIAGQRRAQRLLVSAQLALTVLLLASAGLLLRSYRNLQNVHAGFSTHNVFTFHVSASWSEDRGPLGAMQQRLLSQLQAMPGVVAAGFTNFLPASNATLQYALQIDGLNGPAKDGTFAAGERSVSPGYFQAMGIPVVAGSGCPAMPPFPTKMEGDKALVNQSFVETYLHGASVLGRNFRLLAEGPTAPWSQIVGVVGDVRENSIAVAPTPFLYDCIPAGGWPDPEYVVRTAAGPGGAMQALRGIVDHVAPGRAVFGLQPLSAVMAASLAQPRLDGFGLSLFAGFALLLAAVGLYSLISLLVAARRREMAVRLALGSRPAQAARLVLASTAVLVGWGAAAGVLLTWAGSRLLASLLFGIHTMDALTLIAAVVLVALIALAASWLPALRAARTDPAEVLRGA